MIMLFGSNEDQMLNQNDMLSAFNETKIFIL